MPDVHPELAAAETAAWFKRTECADGAEETIDGLEVGYIVTAPNAFDLDRVRRMDGFAFDKSWGTRWNNLRTLRDQSNSVFDFAA